MALLDQHTLPGSMVNTEHSTGMTQVNHPYDDLNEQAPQEECGVFGVWAPGEEVSKLTYFGLFALQHRGPFQL